MNVYLIETVEDAVRALRENQRKETILHEGRMKAFDEMMDAHAVHDHYVNWCRNAENDTADIYHRLQELVKRDAIRAVEEAA